MGDSFGQPRSTATARTATSSEMPTYSTPGGSSVNDPNAIPRLRKSSRSIPSGSAIGRSAPLSATTFVATSTASAATATDSARRRAFRTPNVRTAVRITA
ncbi:unannotated protein [freshwater metagenome]|uniref:Unannotated protein n=1 Tax=freshwater metagenome TaxID=449393 RepID=A0A6J7KYX4_9ZZZZ